MAELHPEATEDEESVIMEESLGALRVDDGNSGKAICPYCKKEFVKNRPDQKCCSPQCADKVKTIKHENSAHWGVYAKQYREELRDKVYAILGGKCIHCGTTDNRVFSIDHIKGVAVSGEPRKMTVSIYSEILHDPEKAKTKYQLLCRNCNWIKMIEENERHLKNLEFAYRWELDILLKEVADIKNRLDTDSKTPKLEQVVKEQEVKIFNDWIGEVLKRYDEYVSIKPSGLRRTDTGKLILDFGMPWYMANQIGIYLNRHSYEEAMKRSLL